LDTKRQFALAQDNFLRLDYFSCTVVKTRQFALAQSFFDTCTLPMWEQKKLFFFLSGTWPNFLKSLALKSAPKSKRVASNCSFQRKGRVSRRRRSLLALELRGVRLVNIGVGSKHANNINDINREHRSSPQCMTLQSQQAGDSNCTQPRKGHVSLCRRGC
jgi:hypothetical protein